MIRVRFAPSPTGHLHIGGVRTALFNFLFARNQGGEFILRIEDTDVERSSKEMAEEILQGLRWLGLDWDQEPYYQSLHFADYRKIALRLLEEKKAYRCFCTPEQIEVRKKQSSGDIIKYDRQCFHLTDQEITANLGKKIPFTIRFLIPPGQTRFKDRIHKEMKIDNTQLDDYVLLKSDSTPTYHLSVVADDSSMGITHVIRGDDHISNTFKQILLYQALGLKPPEYAHLPLILGEDKKKLSKRHGETSVLEFKKNGYLPEAIVTCLSQLSWLPADDRRIYTLDELVKNFSMAKLSKNNPVFDYNKLRSLNARAIQQRDPQELYQILCEDKEFEKTYAPFPLEKKAALIQLVKPRMKTTAEFKGKFEIYLIGGSNYQQSELGKLNQNIGSQEALIGHLEVFIQGLMALDGFKSEGIEDVLRNCAEKLGIQAAGLIHPSRLALTYETVGPSIFEVFAFFGKKESIERLKDFTAYLEKKKDVLSH